MCIKIWVRQRLTACLLFIVGLSEKVALKPYIFKSSAGREVTIDFKYCFSSFNQFILRTSLTSVKGIFRLSWSKYRANSCELRLSNDRNKSYGHNNCVLWWCFFSDINIIYHEKSSLNFWNLQPNTEVNFPYYYSYPKTTKRKIFFKSFHHLHWT